MAQESATKDILSRALVSEKLGNGIVRLATPTSTVIPTDFAASVAATTSLGRYSVWKALVAIRCDSDHIARAAASSSASRKAIPYLSRA
jgi:hypothetical protein